MILGTNDRSCFRTDILRKTNILMKLKSNLVSIVRSLRTSHSIKKIYMGTFPLTWHPSSPCLHMFAFWWTPYPLSINVIIEFLLPFLATMLLLLVQQIYCRPSPITMLNFSQWNFKLSKWTMKKSKQPETLAKLKIIKPDKHTPRDYWLGKRTTGKPQQR